MRATTLPQSRSKSKPNIARRHHAKSNSDSGLAPLPERDSQARFACSLEETEMASGYFTHTGYMGYVSQAHEYRLFATESDYREYVASEQ